jgi:hypothetical protein
MQIGGKSILLALLLGFFWIGTQESAGASPTGHSITLWDGAGQNGRTTTVLVTGAIVDYGTAFQANSAGHVDSKGRYTELVLTKGSILLRGSGLGPIVQPHSERRHSSTCWVSTTSDTSVSIVSGTAAYSGISGSLIVTTNSVLIFPLTNRGQCQTGAGTSPLADWSKVTASGSVALP